MNAPIFQLDLLFPVLLIFALLLIVLIVWIALRRRLTDTQAKQERQSDQLDVLENKMARLEGALFYGPSATWTMENRRERRDVDDPEVRKRL